VRKQTGLLQHADDRGPDVGQRVAIAVRVQPLAGLARAVGLSPRVNMASLQPSAAPSRAIAGTSLGSRYRLCCWCEMEANVQSPQRSRHLSEQAYVRPLGENRARRVARSLSLSPRLFGRKGPMAGR
jgi:hypothetical protein